MRLRVPDVLAVLSLTGLVSAAALAAPASDGWPQWRGGPARDGVVRQGPKLLETWPTNGPALLWKSDPIEGVGDGGAVGDANAPIGGCGSVSVAGGKAVFFVHGKVRKQQVTFTTEALRRLGWFEGMTTNLAVRIDKAYKFNLVYQPDALKSNIDACLTTLDPADAQAFGDAIRASLSAEWDKRVSWGLLMRLAAMRDQPCASLEEWNQRSGDLLHGHAEHNGEIRSLLNANGFVWQDTVICLDARTGRTLWIRSFPGNPVVGYTFGFLASGTPAIAGDRCYVTGSAGVYCLAMADGAPVWQVPAKFSNSSPLVVGDSVYVFLPDGLSAFDAANGKQRWAQTNAVNALNSGSVALWSHAGRDYLIGYGRRNKGSDLLCVAADTGEIAWRMYGEDGPGYTTPAICGDRAVAFGKGAVWAFDLAPDKGTLAWRSGKTGPGDERGSSVIVAGGCVYAVGGGYANSSACCFDLTSGALKWTQKFDHTETSSPVLAGGRVIANAHPARDQSCTLMFEATPEGYRELGRITPRDEGLNFCASPVVADGRLYLRLRRHIACYNLTQEP